MADKLGITVSYLSAVENGKRPYPNEWTEKIVNLYGLEQKDELEFGDAVSESADSVKIELSNASGQQKNLVFALARKFDTLDEKDLAKIKEILEGNK
jgi:transcriptional regulator with XRE-family HTH domain